MIKAAFCYLYKSFLRHAVDSKNDLLVRAIDYLLGSSCRYCMACRAVLLGLGAGLLFTCWWLGLLLILLAVAMTWGERYYLCE